MFTNQNSPQSRHILIREIVPKEIINQEYVNKMVNAYKKFAKQYFSNETDTKLDNY